MIRTLKTVLAAAALALSLGAQALTLTPQANTVGLAPGGQAVVSFDVDFGSAAFELGGLELYFDFDPTRVAGVADSIAFAVNGPPALNLDDFGPSSQSGHAGGAAMNWSIDGLSGAPAVSGSGVLSIKLSDSFGLLAAMPLQARLVMFTLDDVELSASASLSVVPLPVPEPASWVLALAGGCLLIAVRRRQA